MTRVLRRPPLRPHLSCRLSAAGKRPGRRLPQRRHAPLPGALKGRQEASGAQAATGPDPPPPARSATQPKASTRDGGGGSSVQEQLLRGRGTCWHVSACVAAHATKGPLAQCRAPDVDIDYCICTSVPYLCTIPLYHTSVPYLCTIPRYHTAVPYLCTIPLYHVVCREH